MPEETPVKQPDEMYCHSCGAIIKREAQFCAHCGVRVQPSGQAGAVGAPSRAAELERLHALRGSGALSDQEFEQAKARVLEEASTGVPPVLPTKWNRAELRRRGVCFHEYPVWVMTLLSVITFGVYAVFWLNHWHGLMPQRRTSDPSTGKAIGFLFIPLFNYYWLFESLLRLCTRLDEELAEAGLPDRVPKELVRWYCIGLIVPYVNYLAGPILGGIATGMMQSIVNRLAQFDQECYARDTAGGP